MRNHATRKGMFPLQTSFQPRKRKSFYWMVINDKLFSQWFCHPNGSTGPPSLTYVIFKQRAQSQLVFFSQKSLFFNQKFLLLPNNHWCDLCVSGISQMEKISVFFLMTPFSTLKNIFCRICQLITSPLFVLARFFPPKNNTDQKTGESSEGGYQREKMTEIMTEIPLGRHCKIIIKLKIKRFYFSNRVNNYQN